MAIQLDLFQLISRTVDSAAVNNGKTKSRSRRSRTPASSHPSSIQGRILPAYRAPRGDAFRELFERDRDCALRNDPGQRTVEDNRAERYWRLHWDWGAVFRGKRKLKGPVETLQRKVGRNRTTEFDQWLCNLGMKGSTTVVRYRRRLVALKGEIQNIEFAFRYTDFTTDEASSAGQCARHQLQRATSDVLELQELLAEMGVLYREIRNARLKYACRCVVAEDSNAK